jgi:hypothetical protein
MWILATTYKQLGFLTYIRFNFNAFYFPLFSDKEKKFLKIIKIILHI